MKIRRHQVQPILISILVFLVAAVVSGYLFWDDSLAMILSFLVAASIAVITFLLYWNTTLELEVDNRAKELSTKT